MYCREVTRQVIELDVRQTRKLDDGIDRCMAKLPGCRGMTWGEGEAEAEGEAEGEGGGNTFSK